MVPGVLRSKGAAFCGHGDACTGLRFGDGSGTVRAAQTGGDMFARIETMIERLAKGTAIAGGLVMIAVVAMTCLSITGRALDIVGLGPVPGDFELVEMGIGFAVFASLPWAQLARTHARVDLIKPALPPAANRVLDLGAELALLAFAAVVFWRLYGGLTDKMAYGETTFILQIPLYWGYLAAVVVMGITVATGVLCVLRALRGLGAPTA